MAFQARKNKKGKVVDFQELSRRRSTNSNEIISDSEESIDGFSDRSFGVPTVRFLGSQKPIEEETEPTEDEDLDTDSSSSQHTIVADQDDVDGLLDSDPEDIMNFCQELEAEEARDALTGLSIDGDDLEAIMNCYKNTPRPDGEGELEEQEDSHSETSYESDMGDILKPTVIPGKTKPVDDEDSLDSYNDCSVGSASGRSYITSNATQEDIKLLEASSDRELMSSRTYNMDSLSQSTCSWSHAYGAAFQTSEGRRNVLPSLSLASHSSECSTSTYYKSLEEKKERDGLKFEAWKQRKAAQEQKKLLAAKQLREKQARDLAERSETAKKKFSEWCRLKEEQKQRETKKKPPVHQTSSSRSKETPEEARERVRKWERRKIEEQKQERELLRRHREEQEKEEKKRLQLSEAAYSKWMENIESRPMPVPLNQGLDTLRGTVSNIYVNPNKWDSSTDPLSDSDDRGI
ncbi:stress response protein NST1 [Drosophila obscura]|uniref:stress response protein NST1 n=1 Tax=Drosophila obscura TaxID=7282 RepID=UPI001BB246F6|nr:stress response protein NST1 [Drosophila obscura]